MHRPSLGAFDGYVSTIFSYTEAALIASECYSAVGVDSRRESAGIDANCTVLRNAIGVFTRRKDLPDHASVRDGEITEVERAAEQALGDPDRFHLRNQQFCRVPSRSVRLEDEPTLTLTST
jgi:hypothetical protein